MKVHACLLVCVIALTGCIFQGDKLKFETIAKGDSSYQGEDPLFFVATSYEDTLTFVTYIQHEDELKAVDFNTYVVVCAFQGVKPKGYDIQIQELIREERSIIFLTTFREPTFGEPISTEYASPFHLVKVKKSEIGLQGLVSFLLQDTKGFLHAKVDVII